MKNQMDFKVPLSCNGSVNFINCFASMYVHFEGISEKIARKCGDKTCGACTYFQLFAGMSGESLVRRHYGGMPTEMQKLIGNYDKYGCGTDYTVDFLFGFTGYEYRKCVDSKSFKDEIIASIDAEKPVLAQIKQHCNGTFHIITGYDGDTLLTANYAYAQNAPSGSLEYEDIETLYIFGKKITPRFTLADALERSKKMMECNINEKVWDGYIEKINEHLVQLPGKEFTQLSPEEEKSIMKELTEAVWCAWTTWNFMNAFSSSIHSELENPELVDLTKKIFAKGCECLDIGHALNWLNNNNGWLQPARNGMGMMLLMTVEKYKQIDAELLDLINQAIEVSSMSKKQLV